MGKPGFFTRELTDRRKATLRSAVIGLVALAALGSVAVFAWTSSGRDPASSPDADRTLPVETQIVRHDQMLVLKRDFTGRVEAARQSQLSFERGGLLVAVMVDEGDAVTAGQALAELDAEPLRLRAEQLRAEHRAAGARLREMQAGPRPERIAAAQAQLRARAARVAFWERELRRVEGLVERGAAGEKELRDAMTEHDAARALRDAAAAELAELEAGTRMEQIEAQRAVVAQLAAARARVELDLEKSTMRAPFAGSIAARHADEGLVVAAGTPVLEILETARLELRVGIAAGFADELAINQLHELEVGGQTVAARVARIRPQLDDATRTITVVLDVPPEPAIDIRPGQTVRLRLEDHRPQRGVWLPTDALVKGERGLWAVYVVLEGDDTPAGGVLERRDVEILYTTSSRVYVRGLLHDGEAVVASGAHRVVPGQRVTVIENATVPVAQADRDDPS
jgi:multidrug efflux pump subunit AcrA (membrane-fusion protein)